MAAVFPFLPAAGFASRTPCSHPNSSGNGLHFSASRVPPPAVNAMLDFHTQTILNMFRSAQQQQQQNLLKVST